MQPLCNLRRADGRVCARCCMRAHAALWAFPAAAPFCRLRTAKRLRTVFTNGTSKIALFPHREPPPSEITKNDVVSQMSESQLSACVAPPVADKMPTCRDVKGGLCRCQRYRMTMPFGTRHRPKGRFWACGRWSFATRPRLSQPAARGFRRLH